MPTYVHTNILHTYTYIHTYNLICMYRFRACIISNNELGAKARRRGAVDIASAPETEDLSSKPAKGKKFLGKT
jgi:hypothetical protein